MCDGGHDEHEAIVNHSDRLPCYQQVASDFRRYLLQTLRQRQTYRRIARAQLQSCVMQKSVCTLTKPQPHQAVTSPLNKRLCISPAVRSPRTGRDFLFWSKEVLGIDQDGLEMSHIFHFRKTSTGTTYRGTCFARRRRRILVASRLWRSVNLTIVVVLELRRRSTTDGS